MASCRSGGFNLPRARHIFVNVFFEKGVFFSDKLTACLKCAREKKEVEVRVVRIRGKFERISDTFRDVRLNFEKKKFFFQYGEV